MARRTTAHFFHSVNGVVEAPNLWQFDAFGPDEMQLMGRSIADVADVVIGRALWQEWSQYWAAADGDDPFARFINPVRKHVVSTTLRGELGWNSTVIDSDPIGYVNKLKQDGSGDIAVVGGIQTTRGLFVGGAIDALTLTVHPVVTPEGRRLFDESVPLTRLELVDSTITGVGNAVLTYALRS